ncbi:MAG: transporter [Gammaproteobacteria bacterium]|jgi:SP family galactose:H+ symporter-like MFS transporter|nr:transporter [Gammaproteobacteria bacterium]
METVQTLKNKPFVYIVGITAALAGLLFGIDIGAISGALPFLKQDFQLSTIQQEAVVSSILAGAVIGTLFSGFITRHYGRRFAILVSALIFSVGSILSAFSVSVTMLIIVRLFLGLALGLASFTAPLYLSEVAPKNVRGALIALYQLMITIGILAAFLSDTAFSLIGSWRWMLGLPFFPAFAMFLAVLMLPKSPRWLMLRGNKEQAMAVLDRVRHPHEVEGEIEEIESSLSTTHSIKTLLKNRFFVKVLFLGIAFQIIQQFSGINTVMYYAPTIFQMAGFASHIDQMWGTVAVGTVNVLTTIVSILLVDKLGRRPILYFGLCVTTLSLFVLGYLFHVGISTPVLQYSAVACLLLFIMGFAVSLGPIMWILCAEIYPLQGRDIGVTVTTATNWLCNAIIGFTFLSLLSALGPHHTFWLFSGIGLLSLVFIRLFTPETKDVSLEQIEANLFAGKSCRNLGR